MSADDTFIVPLPDGADGSAVLDLACRAVRGELLSGSAWQQLAELVAHGRWASQCEIASLENVVAPAECAALVDEATADELAVLPVTIVEFDCGVLNGSPVDLVHSDFSSVVGGTSTVAEAGGASSAPGGGQ